MKYKKGDIVHITKGEFAGKKAEVVVSFYADNGYGVIIKPEFNPIEVFIKQEDLVSPQQ